LTDSVLPARLSEQQLKLLAAIYRGLRQLGKWPSAYMVDKALDKEGLNLEEVAATLPRGLTNLSSRPFRGDEEATLTPGGLSYVREAVDDADVFMRILWLSTEAEQAFELPTDGSPVNGPLISSQRLQQELGAPTEQLMRMANFLKWEPWTGAGTWYEDRFDFHVTREVRRYRGVQTLRDYAERRLQSLAAAYGQVPPVGGPRPLRVAPAPIPMPGSANAIPATPAETQSKVVFVMMTFGEATNPLYRKVQEACQAVGVRCFRADEIEQAGRITPQILEAIASADAIVADIGDLNPNVMYELGYADALKKEIIVLNSGSGAPFDLKDLRWIRYEIGSLSAIADKLPRFLRNTLRLEGES